MGCALFFAGKWNSFFLCDHIQSKYLLVCFPSGTIVLQAGERRKPVKDGAARRPS